MFGWLKKSSNPTFACVQPREAVLPLSLIEPSFVADPYPAYAWLREQQPVCELEGGGFLLTRYEDIRAAFTNPNLGNAPSRFSTLSSRNSQKYVAADLASHIPPFLDAPTHVEMRQMASRAFFECFKQLDGKVEQIAKKYVAQLKDGDDLIRHASQSFALQVMCEFCGLRVEPSQMKQYSQAFFHLFAPLRDPAVFAQVNDALAEFRQVIAQSLAARPAEDTLLHALKAFQAEQSAITDAQIIDNCLLIFADGIENIEAGAALLLHVFSQHDVHQKITQGDITLDGAIQEGLRLQTPAQLIPRVARAECEIAGTLIKKDVPVFLALASGNRDARKFQNPDSFELGRDAKENLTFGQGRHRCIGEPLAMVQLHSLMQELLESGFCPASQDLHYQTRVGHRWPNAMKIKKS